jgi:hypothetical protein
MPTPEADQIPGKVRELVDILNATKADRAEEMPQSRQSEKPLEDVGAALDYVRLCLKYLLFDLEAERRDNLYLRRKAASQEGPDRSYD